MWWYDIFTVRDKTMAGWAILRMDDKGVEQQRK